MKKIFIIVLVIVLFSGCSSKTYFSSDSDAYLQYDRIRGSWELIWTWKMKKGRSRTDTIRIMEKPIEGNIFLADPAGSDRQ